MRCQPGDMAAITKRIPVNVGKVVLVVEYFGEVDYPHLNLWKLPCWSVESMGGPLKKEDGQFADGGYIPDMALRPIGQTTVTKADLAQARAEAELKAAWKNLADVVRESLRQASLPEGEMAESNEGVTR
jgi:hypothetical protein